MLIADDHTMFRQGIRALLEAHGDIEVVGEACDGREAVDKAQQLVPDVVLMDIAMPLLGGVDAIRHIRRQRPEIKILALTQYEDSEYVLAAVRAGACGYVSKSAAASELVSAIQVAYRGEYFLHPTAATVLIQDYLKRAQAKEDDYELLTLREREVLKLVAEGRSNREIADILSLSVKTVLRHKTNIMEKLGTHNRTELIRYAISKGLIEMPPKLGAS